MSGEQLKTRGILLGGEQPRTGGSMMTGERSMEVKEDEDEYDVICENLKDVKQGLATHIKDIDSLADRLFGIVLSTSTSPIPRAQDVDDMNPSEVAGVVGEIVEYTKDILALLRGTKMAFSRIQK